MKVKNWYRGVVLRGKKLGRSLGFPTINLDPKILKENFRDGVYAAKAKIENKVFSGALYFGPRLVLGEKHRVLEIFLLDFHQEIYGQAITFQVRNFIRGPLNFSTTEQLKTQLKNDVELVKNLESVS